MLSAMFSKVKNPIAALTRKTSINIGLALSLVFLSACDPQTFNLGNVLPKFGKDKPLPVALLVPYNSTQAADNNLAKSLENAARLAIADLQNGTSETPLIDLRVYPTGGQPDTASQAASKAIEDGAKVILGPVYGGNAKTAGLAAANSGVKVLSFSNNPAIAGGNVYILGSTFKNTANRLVNFAKFNGKSNIMIVNAQSPAENAGASAIKAAIAQNDASLVAEQSFELSQNGVVQAIRPIVRAARSSNANALFITSGNDGAMPLLGQLLPEEGLEATNIQYIGLQRWDNPASARALPGLQGSWFAIPDPQLAAQFSQRYLAQYGTQPHSLSSIAYDGIAALGALIKGEEKDFLSDAAITRPNGFLGVNGVFRFLADGTNERSLSIATIENNEVIELEPAPRSFFASGF